MCIFVTIRWHHTQQNSVIPVRLSPQSSISTRRYGRVCSQTVRNITAPCQTLVKWPFQQRQLHQERPSSQCWADFRLHLRGHTKAICTEIVAKGNQNNLSNMKSAKPWCWLLSNILCVTYIPTYTAWEKNMAFTRLCKWKKKRGFGLERFVHTRPTRAQWEMCHCLIK